MPTYPTTAPREVYRFGDFTLDTGARSLCRSVPEDEALAIALTPKEYATLLRLVESGGDAVSKESLMQAVWPDTVVGDTSLARNVSSLRRHLGAAAIEVVPKYGYRLTLPVTLVEPAAAETAPEAPILARPMSVLRTPGARLWAAAGVVLLVAGLSAARFISPRHALSASPRRTWTDPQTRLTWAGKDNGHDVTRQQATDYCAAYDPDGHRGWRLPTIAEAQTLYDTSVSLPGIWEGSRPVYWHVKGNLTLTGDETASDLTWLTDATPAGEVQTYDFSFGRRNYNTAGFKAGHRALCVR